MSHIGQGQEGEVLTASGNVAAWQAAVAGATAAANDSNFLLAAEIFII